MINRSVVNQVAYNKTFNLLASSGVEKIVKIWSKFNQELFPRSRPLDSTIERSSHGPGGPRRPEGDAEDGGEGGAEDGNEAGNEDGRSKRDIYIDRVLNAEANGEGLEENSDEDEEIIAFFDALRGVTGEAVWYPKSDFEIVSRVILDL